ncbi:MAG TPA: maleylpyruvate isomerase family mycothiol-dependent enzyme [Pseudonocardiaceae bacterium]|nr:maleylpyruvate isomerase family mycothiol-dependent enzyme [Pseudonocardiaceae bacterium]
MSSWMFSDPDSKKNLLGLIRREAEGMFALVDNDEQWMKSTACEFWNAADVIGHLVDTTETYFIGFDAARGKGTPPSSVALTSMAGTADVGARQFRQNSRTEMIDRCRADMEKMIGIFEGLSDAEWTGLTVQHKYMGPLPACFYAVGQLVDYAVHSWDIREGQGMPHVLAADSADMLVPLALVVWQSTPKVPADTEPFQVGIRITSGENAGDSMVSVSPDGIAVEPADVSGAPAVIEFDPATFVLTAFGRINAGTARGDVAIATRFLGSFFRI